MTISTYNLFKDDWLFVLYTKKTTYRGFGKGCSLGKILGFITRSLIQELKFRMRGL